MYLKEGHRYVGNNLFVQCELIEYISLFYLCDSDFLFFKEENWVMGVQTEYS